MFEEILFRRELSFMQECMVDALQKHGDSDRIATVFAEVCSRLEEARAKHPRFAEQVYHALSFLSEEHGEVVREVTKGRDGWGERMDSELLDLIVVAMRMLMREYEHGEDDAWTSASDILIDKMFEQKQISLWLAAQLFEAIGRPPDELFSHESCADCADYCQPKACAVCWCRAARRALKEEA